MKILRTEIEINASAERVWQVLADSDAYPLWNPFISRLTGTLKQGGRLEIRLIPPGGMAMTFHPVVLAVAPNREIRWIGRLVMPGLFDGEHHFEIEPLGPDRVRFIQEERFSGVLVPFLAASLDRHTKAGFKAMNEALKIRAERSAA